jgi:hypothetical protein
MRERLRVTDEPMLVGTDAELDPDTEDVDDAAEAAFGSSPATGAALQDAKASPNPRLMTLMLLLFDTVIPPKLFFRAFEPSPAL